MAAAQAAWARMKWGMQQTAFSRGGGGASPHSTNRHADTTARSRVPMPLPMPMALLGGDGDGEGLGLGLGLGLVLAMSMELGDGDACRARGGGASSQQHSSSVHWQGVLVCGMPRPAAQASPSLRSPPPAYLGWGRAGDVRRGAGGHDGGNSDGGRRGVHLSVGHGGSHGADVLAGAQVADRGRCGIGRQVDCRRRGDMGDVSMRRGKRVRAGEAPSDSRCDGRTPA